MAELKKVFSLTDAMALKGENVEIPFGFTEIAYAAFETDEYIKFDHIKSIALPDSVEIIQKQAFSGMRIESITISKSVREIGIAAFHSCERLKEIIVDKDNEYYTVVNGDLYSKDGTVLHTCLSGKGKSVFTTPDSVKEIKDNAFSNCKSLKVFTISGSVTAITADAFMGCWNLKNILVDENNRDFISVDGIIFSKGMDVLVKYPNLPHEEQPARYAVPESVSIIGDGAFSYIKGLTRIRFPEKLREIGNGAFTYCQGLTSVSLPTGIMKIGAGAFYSCDNLSKVYIPIGIEKLEQTLFYRCNKLESITIPPSVTEIGDGVFGYCKALRNIELPEGLTKIEYYAFGNCNNLQAVRIPDSVEEIDSQAFVFCTALTVHCSKKSYAHEYCMKNKIRVRII